MAAREKWKPDSRVPSQARSLYHSPAPNPHRFDDRPQSLTPNPVWKSPDRNSIPPASPFTPAPVTPAQYSVASGRYETPEIRAGSRRDQSCNTTPQDMRTSQDAQTMTSPEPRTQLLERHEALLFPRRRGPMNSLPKGQIGIPIKLKPREIEEKDTTHHTAMNWRFVEDEIVHNVATGQRRNMKDNMPGLSQLITLHILNRDEHPLPPVQSNTVTNNYQHQNIKW